MTAPRLFDRALLRARRDRVAANAAPPDFLLRRAAEDMAERLQGVERSFARILNIGAHHGILAAALKAAHSAADLVINMEASAPLLALCGSPKVRADEEALPFRDGAFDLVASALSLQFVNDLPGALIQIRRALKPDGLFLGAVLGGATLQELRLSFAQAEVELEGGISPRVAPMADIRDFGGLLQRAGFALPVADADLVAVTYSSPLALMLELRAMGAGNVLTERRKRPMRRATLTRAMEIYAERFPASGGRVAATFEIIHLAGWVPHESQQKPLKPGSAQARLAEALGVDEHKLKGSKH
ncbi:MULTISPECIES: methyltransferase domain-containing protein [Rhodomicrobium]|uniref:methyltransferase domain-containing protein n=1 Tax=Rhodomicrobium TaxID=1068 RepID=UPI000B4AAB48|nr:MULTISPECIES: methyltransferase domain-containing protein [Rhodomicrobium]